MLWYKQPPERRGPSLEVWKTLTEDHELHSMFLGLLDGGAPGNVGVRVWGTKPADPKVVAHRRSAGRSGPGADHLCADQGLPWCWTSKRNSGATPRRYLGRRCPSMSNAAPN